MRRMKFPLLIVVFAYFLTACQVSNQDKHNEEMSIFIDNLLSKMTIKEKIGQFNLITPGGGVPAGEVVNTNVNEKIKNGQVGGMFGINTPEKARKAQQLAVEQSRLGIPMLFGSDVIHGYRTTFPLPLAMSCSWDLDMIEKTAQIAAKEATADGIFWNFSPMVDISRDPRWGRVAEGAGEDPYLGAEIAKVMVKGYQQSNLAAPHTMMSTIKHLALYGAPEAGRDYNSVDMSRQRMFNEYMPPYKAAVEAGAGCVMTSFNDIDGIPASGNKWLLTEILRETWGFEGFVVSDYTSVTEMVEHGLGDTSQVAAMALKAGLDMEIVGESLVNTLEASLEKGLVTEEDINNACRRILEAKYKLGLFEDPYRYADTIRPERDILTEENRHFARRVVARSCVLLKNDNEVLPLQKKGTIALVGPLANSQNNMLGTWSPTGKHELAIKVIDGMKQVAGNNAKILYAKGANIVDDPDYAKKINVFGKKVEIDEGLPEELIKEALTISQKADVIVAVVGEASEMSGESASRTNLLLPEAQKKLIRALKKTGKPLVLIIMSGRPLALEEENDLADAILQAWHPGVEAGPGIADVVFGNYNPSGKITMTFPRNVGQVPIYYSLRNTGRPQDGDTFKKFRTNYLDAPNSPLFPFGYGLSYTTFSYSNLNFSKKELTASEQLKISVDITNTGNYDGEEVVQLYVRDLVASVTRPIKELKGFDKVFLKTGETKTVQLTLTVSDLKFFNFKMEYDWEPGEFEIMVGANSVNLISDIVNWQK